MEYVTILGRKIPVVGAVDAQGKLNFPDAESEATFKLSKEQRQRLATFSAAEQIEIIRVAFLAAAQCMRMIRRADEVFQPSSARQSIGREVIKRLEQELALS